MLDVIGTPMIALLAGVILAMFTLGTAVGFGRQKISATIGGSLPAIAGILLIVAAGGGFKQVLIDAGVGDLVGRTAEDLNISALVLGWLVAVGIRLATGSATVATITAAGIVAPLAAGLDANTVALLALAIGSGSLFFSHVNDAGFWLVKEYFGMTVGQTIKSWSVMETIISVVGLLSVLAALGRRLTPLTRNGAPAGPLRLGGPSTGNLRRSARIGRGRVGQGAGWNREVVCSATATSCSWCSPAAGWAASGAPATPCSSGRSR